MAKFSMNFPLMIIINLTYFSLKINELLKIKREIQKSKYAFKALATLD